MTFSGIGADIDISSVCNGIPEQDKRTKAVILGVYLQYKTSCKDRLKDKINASKNIDIAAQISYNILNTEIASIKQLIMNDYATEVSGLMNYCKAVNPEEQITVPPVDIDREKLNRLVAEFADVKEAKPELKRLAEQFAGQENHNVKIANVREYLSSKIDSKLEGLLPKRLDGKSAGQENHIKEKVNITEYLPSNPDSELEKLLVA